MLVRFLLNKLRGRNSNPLSNFILLNHPNNCGSCYFQSTATEIQSCQESKDANITVSYLVNTFGFRLDSAKRWSTKIDLTSSDKPDAVLMFFKDYGFTDTQIARIVRSRPQVLFTDPERFLKPKVEILESFGAPPDTVAQIVEKSPVILCTSLDKRLLPCLETLKSLVITDSNVVQMMLRCNKLFYFHLPDTLVPNVATLREVGVSESVVLKTLGRRMVGLLCPPDKFRKAVLKVKRMGFDLNQFNFVEAVVAITSLSDHLWDQRCRTFRKWGWSDTDLVNAFLKNPTYMGCTQKKIDKIMDFLLNFTGLTPSCAAEIPSVFKYGTERIVARFSLIKTLIAKGVITKDDWKLGSVIVYSELVFLEKFVKKHSMIVPELTRLYSQSKKDGKPF